MILIDNIDKRFGGSVPERLVTNQVYTDRILGASKTASCPNQATLIANGNNLSLTPDMTRRTLFCQLEPGCENPELRRFKRDLQEYATQNRVQLVSAAITVAQSWLLARDSCTDTFPPPLASFGAWDAIVRQALLWLGEPDPVESQREIKDQDEGKAALTHLLETWYLRLRGEPVGARELLQYCQVNRGEFANAVGEICSDRTGQSSAKLLGYYLKRNCGIVAGGFRIVRGSRRQSGFSWAVEPVTDLPDLNNPKNELYTDPNPFYTHPTPTLHRNETPSVQGIAPPLLESRCKGVKFLGSPRQLHGRSLELGNGQPFDIPLDSTGVAENFTSLHSDQGASPENPPVTGFGGDVKLVQSGCKESNFALTLHPEALLGNPVDGEPRKNIVEYNGVVIEVEDCHDF